MVAGLSLGRINARPASWARVDSAGRGKPQRHLFAVDPADDLSPAKPAQRGGHAAHGLIERALQR